MRADGTLEAIVKRNQRVKVDAIEDEKRRIQEEPFN
jgi:hypothetical protein